MSALSPKRLAEIRDGNEGMAGPVADDLDDLLIHVDHLTAENARLRAGVEEARLYCVRSTFCIPTPPTEGETDDANA